ncbi:thermonuclease family protein [Aerosakkonemataceae cyanobacterium BLCC-F154]|uniref:Thermonuclease family protein n=1 Tax=Floridaenema fluviatile BLCC-F154 TaxID=3153640 RepID=A0ABV4Y7C2_9CYAN
MIYFRKLIPIALVVGLAGCNLFPSQNTYRVQRVSDGDTIAVSQGDKSSVTVRFACIDAPEVPHSNREKNSQKLLDKNQFNWGVKAKSRVQQLVNQGGDRVVLNITDTDRYGRQIAEVRLPNGKFIQEVLIREGLALVNRPYLRYCPSREIIEQAETDAKTNLRGVWKDPKFVAPWDYRRIK